VVPIVADQLFSLSSLPRAMKAVRLFEYGDPSVLQYLDVPLPELGSDDVLMRVRATSVSHWDLRYRRGGLTPPKIRDGSTMPLAAAMAATLLP